MKRTEQLRHYQNSSIAELRQEVDTIEKQLQSHRFAIAFNKSKQVRLARTYKKQLARLLTEANKKLNTVTTGEEK